MDMKMDPALRAQLLDRLAHRAARLAACASVNHPAHNIDTILALMARHVATTAMALLGETFSREVFSSLFETHLESYGICRFCGVRPLRKKGVMCQVCWDQAASDDEITDDELAAAAADALSEADPPSPGA